MSCNSEYLSQLNREKFMLEMKIYEETTRLNKALADRGKREHSEPPYKVSIIPGQLVGIAPGAQGFCVDCCTKQCRAKHL